MNEDEDEDGGLVMFNVTQTTGLHPQTSALCLLFFAWMKTIEKQYIESRNNFPQEKFSGAHPFYTWEIPFLLSGNTPR